MNKINAISYGTYKRIGKECYDCVSNAILCGYRTIDTADLYKNHIEVGNAINDSIKKGIISRNDICIITKIHNRDQKNNSVYEAVHRFIKELNQEYIDIILLHSPIDEFTVKSYTDLTKAKNENLIKHIGVSNFNIKNLKILLDNNYCPYINQIELSIFCHRDELVKFCKDNSIIVQAHSCLTNGIKIHDKNDNFIENMIKWLLNQNIYVVIGSKNIDHMKKNFDSDQNNNHINHINLDQCENLDCNFFIYKYRD